MRGFTWKKALFITILLGMVYGGVHMYFYINDLVQPVLMPVNQEYAGYANLPQKKLGLKLEPFVFRGGDGGEVQAVVVTKEGEESPRQSAVTFDLNRKPADNLGIIEYVLVCVNWDHGVLSALPLAESLTAAGLTCVLWDPRGVGDRRVNCTHGLKESADVPLLLDALKVTPGKYVVGVGQGYGAGLLLQAAAQEPRIRGLVCIDSMASLRLSVERTLPKAPLKSLTLALMDLKINSSVGFECFDVAPIESASRLSRDVPVLVVNMVRNSPVSTLHDAVAIYRQLPSDVREVWTLRGPGDRPGAEHREVVYTSGQGEKMRSRTVDVHLERDEESTVLGIIHWLDGVMVPAWNSRPLNEPERPNLRTDIGDE